LSIPPNTHVDYEAQSNLCVGTYDLSIIRIGRVSNTKIHERALKLGINSKFCIITILGSASAFA